LNPRRLVHGQMAKSWALKTDFRSRSWSPEDQDQDLDLVLRAHLVEAPVEDPLHALAAERHPLDLAAHVSVVEGQRLAGG